MMALAAAALLLAQDEGELRLKIEEKERELRSFDRIVRDALDAGDEVGARRFEREMEGVQNELDGLRRQLDALREERTRPRPSGPLTLSAEVLLTHWDNDLELADGTGTGVSAALWEAALLRVRRWGAEDELIGRRAEVLCAEAGLASPVWLARGRAALSMPMSAGVIRFESEGSKDTGWILSFDPQYRHVLTDAFSFTAGLGLDLLRSDFNSERTRTHHTFSATLSFDVSF